MGIFNWLQKKPRLPLEVVRAADMGDETAKQKLQEAFDNGMTADEHNELRWEAYKSLAEQGDAVSQYWIGFLYSMEKRDREKTIYWYELSASQGNTDAMWGLVLGYGEYVNILNPTPNIGPVPLGYDIEKEIYWLKKANECGDLRAMFECIERGLI